MQVRVKAGAPKHLNSRITPTGAAAKSAVSPHPIRHRACADIAAHDACLAYCLHLAGLVSHPASHDCMPKGVHALRVLHCDRTACMLACQRRCMFACVQL
eukprot:364789-Chlamydomonas_euryale.AAC.9